MKYRLVWVAAALFAIPAGARADWVMVQKVEEAGKRAPSEITLKVKGAKIRSDVTPDVSVIVDTASGDTLTLQHSRKTALPVSAQGARQLRERFGQPGPEATARLETTGKREKVGGKETEIYTVQAGSVKLTYWIAMKDPDWDKFLGIFGPLQKSAMVQLAGGMAGLPADFKLPGLPLKTEMESPEGRKITTTIVSIKEQPLEDIDFVLPRGYRLLEKPIFGPASSTP